MQDCTWVCSVALSKKTWHPIPRGFVKLSPWKWKNYSCSIHHSNPQIICLLNMYSSAEGGICFSQRSTFSCSGADSFWWRYILNNKWCPCYIHLSPRYIWCVPRILVRGQNWEMFQRGSEDNRKSSTMKIFEWEICRYSPSWYFFRHLRKIKYLQLPFGNSWPEL